jgi:AcrR family transcriptional regulator
MAVLSRRTVAAETRRTNEDALLAATIQLLDEGSAFADLSIEQIVRAAGLSRPTFYTYFRDKRGLVLRLGEALTADIVAVAEPWLEFAGGGSARDTIAAVLDVFRRHRATVRAMSEAATYDPEAEAYWQAFHTRFMPGAQKRVAAGDPTLDEQAVAARAYSLVWMTECALTEHISRPAVDESALVEQLAWLWQSATNTVPPA